MTDTPQVLLAHHLKALKLPTFLREHDKLARQCAADGVDHPRYLLRLAELELIDREVSNNDFAQSRRCGGRTGGRGRYRDFDDSILCRDRHGAVQQILARL
jgi:hypothetical protein